MESAFTNIVVAPYSSLLQRQQGKPLHEGGPIWPDWDQQVAARHCRAGRPVDHRPEVPAVSREIDEAQWCGPIWAHFGHMVAEFGMRLLPSVLNGCPAPILFSGFPADRYRNDADRLQAAPSFFRSIIEYAGVERDRLIVEPDGLRIRTLFVEPQAEQLYGPGPNERHLDMLDAHAERALGPATRRTAPIFVSRAGMFSRFAGENYLESLFERAGVRVIRPERLPLKEQLSLYRSSDLVIFSEGSAMHAPQLLGHCFDRVVVFDRRVSDGKSPLFNRHSLAPRCREITYRGFVRDFLCLHDGNGRSILNLGITLIDREAFLNATVDAGVTLRDLWEDSAFRDAEMSDIESWLKAAKAHGRWAHASIQVGIEQALSRNFPGRFTLN